MFSATKPTDKDIDSFLERAAGTAFSYPDIGATKDPSSTGLEGYTIDHNRIQLGNGDEVFETAKQAIREWQMFDLGWVNLCWTTTPIETGQVVAILIRHFGFYSLNAAMIVYTLDESDRFGFAYGTLQDHGESGEERFSVTYESETGDVSYDIYAFSRPSHFLAKLGYPLTRMLQKRFANDSKQAMLRAVRDNRIN